MPERFTGGFVQTNAYLVSTADGSSVVIDAPAGTASWLKSLGVVPTALLLTHQHYDHVEDAAAVSAMGAKVHAWAPYSPALTLQDLMRSVGFPVSVAPFTVDEVLAESASVEIGGSHITLAHVPGHSADSLTYFFSEKNELYAGDTLFKGSIGRTDLPGGDHQLLLDGIRTKLFVLPPEARVFPGHGQATSIGAERAGNPFL